MAWFRGVTPSGVGSSVAGVFSSAKGAAGSTISTLKEESGLSHLGEGKREDGLVSLGQICGEIAKSSLIQVKWQRCVVDPLLHMWTVNPNSSLIVKICKRVVLTILSLAITMCNLALIPFYIIENAFFHLGKIFTAPWAPDLIKEKRYVVRFGTQIPESLGGVLTSLIEGPVIGLSATLLDLTRFGKSF